LCGCSTLTGYPFSLEFLELASNLNVLARSFLAERGPGCLTPERRYTSYITNIFMNLRDWNRWPMARLTAILSPVTRTLRTYLGRESLIGIGGGLNPRRRGNSGSCNRDDILGP